MIWGNIQINQEKESELGENLAELCLELRVDLVESATEVRELSASLIGDEDLSPPFPIYGPRRFECHIRHFLACSAHFFLYFPQNTH